LIHFYKRETMMAGSSRGLGRLVVRCCSRPLHCLATPRLPPLATPSPSPAVAVSFNNRSIIVEQNRRFFSKKEADPEEAKAEEGTEISEGEKLLHEKIADLNEKNADLLDKYKRSLADFENLRNRMNKQVADAKLFGIQGFCKDLLDVADVLNKAITSVPGEQLEKESQYLKDMHQGLELTETQLLKVFAKHGLVQENPIGEKFDPNKHDALFQIPDPEKEVNTVLNVQKIGYILQGRTIRPAAVGVSRK